MRALELLLALRHFGEEPREVSRSLHACSPVLHTFVQSVAVLVSECLAFAGGDARLVWSKRYKRRLRYFHTVP